MLKCENVQSQMSAYLDREMPAWRVQLTQWHLRRCPVCAHEAARLQQTDKILHQLEPMKTSDDFLPDLMRQVSAVSLIEKHQTPLIRRIVKKVEASFAWAQYSLRLRPPAYTLAAILALLVTIGSVTTLYYPRKSPLPAEKPPILAQSPIERAAIIPIEIIYVQPSKRILPIERRNQ